MTKLTKKWLFFCNFFFFLCQGKRSRTGQFRADPDEIFGECQRGSNKSPKKFSDLSNQEQLRYSDVRQCLNVRRCSRTFANAWLCSRTNRSSKTSTVLDCYNFYLTINLVIPIMNMIDLRALTNTLV